MTVYPSHNDRLKRK